MFNDLTIRNFLSFINTRIEDAGNTLSTFRYKPQKTDLDFLPFLHDFEELIKLTDVCRNRGFLEIKELGVARNFVLTEKGQEYALEKINENFQNVYNITTNGNTQIGNYNSINIFDVYNQLNQLDAPDEQKKSLKDLLKKTVEHPLFNTLVSLGSALIPNIVKK